MPGFLEVYGYYSPKLKAWNIDVGFFDSQFRDCINLFCPAHRPTAHLIFCDHWNICCIITCWSHELQARKKAWLMECLYSQRCCYSHYAWNDEYWSSLRCPAPSRYTSSYLFPTRAPLILPRCCGRMVSDLFTTLHPRSSTCSSPRGRLWFLSNDVVNR